MGNGISENLLLSGSSFRRGLFLFHDQYNASNNDGNTQNKEGDADQWSCGNPGNCNGNEREWKSDQKSKNTKANLDDIAKEWDDVGQNRDGLEHHTDADEHEDEANDISND